MKSTQMADYSVLNNAIINNFDISFLKELKKDIEVYETNKTLLAKYTSLIKDRDVIIFGSGPTRNYFKSVDLKSDNLIKIAVNGEIFNKDYKYDLLFMSDYKNMVRKGITVEVLRKSIDDGTRVCFGRNIHRYLRYNKTEYYIPDQLIEELDGKVDILYYTNKQKEVVSKYFTRLLYAYFSIGHIALLFSIYCCAKRVFLVGFDQGGNVYADGSHRSKTVGNELAATPTDLKAIKGFRMIEKIARKIKSKTEVVSVNPINLAGIFTDMYTKSFNEVSPQQTSSKNILTEL